MRSAILFISLVSLAAIGCASRDPGPTQSSTAKFADSSKGSGSDSSSSDNSDTFNTKKKSGGDDGDLDGKLKIGDDDDGFSLDGSLKIHWNDDGKDDSDDDDDHPSKGCGCPSKPNDPN